jgi:chorismate mutase
MEYEALAVDTPAEPQSIQASAHVQDVVQQAQTELQQLLRQRAEIMRKIGTVKQTISGLANLFGDEILSDDLLQLLDRKPSGRRAGFTKACRSILMNAKRPLTAREMCEQIKAEMPLILQRHKDPMASVTTVLNRLVTYGEAGALILESGRRAWQWISDERAIPPEQKVA